MTDLDSCTRHNLALNPCLLYLQGHNTGIELLAEGKYYRIVCQSRGTSVNPIYRNQSCPWASIIYRVCCRSNVIPHVHGRHALITRGRSRERNNDPQIRKFIFQENLRKKSKCTVTPCFVYAFPPGIYTPFTSSVPGQRCPSGTAYPRSGCIRHPCTPLQRPLPELLLSP